jgi:hypothetical protein
VLTGTDRIDPQPSGSGPSAPDPAAGARLGRTDRTASPETGGKSWVRTGRTPTPVRTPTWRRAIWWEEHQARTSPLAAPARTGTIGSALPAQLDVIGSFLSTNFSAKCYNQF